MKQVIIRQPADHCTAWHLPSNHCYQDPIKKKKSEFHREEFRPVTSSPFSDRWIMLHWVTWSICVAQCILAFAAATWAVWMCKLGARSLVLCLKRSSPKPPTWQEGQARVRVCKEGGLCDIVIVMQAQALQHFQSCGAYIQVKDGKWMEQSYICTIITEFFYACMQYLVLFILFILSAKFFRVLHIISALG